MRPPRLRMALRVWQRHARVFLKLWRHALPGPLIDPLLFLLALGFGLGSYVGDVQGGSYPEFLAPALCACAAMWAASFETTYVLFWRMHEGRVHDNVLTTPVEVEDIVLGELLWAGTRACLHGTSFLLVIAALGYVDSRFALLLPPFLFLGGLTFAGVGMAFTMFVRTMDSLAAFFTLVLNPMFLFGGVFYPTEMLPGWAQPIAWLAPTQHLVGIARALTSGAHVETIASDAVWLTVSTMLLAVVPLLVLRRRLVL